MRTVSVLLVARAEALDRLTRRSAADHRSVDGAERLTAAVHVLCFPDSSRVQAGRCTDGDLHLLRL